MRGKMLVSRAKIGQVCEHENDFPQDFHQANDRNRWRSALRGSQCGIGC